MTITLEQIQSIAENKLRSLIEECRKGLKAARLVYANFSKENGKFLNKENKEHNVMKKNIMMSIIKAKIRLQLYEERLRNVLDNSSQDTVELINFTVKLFIKRNFTFHKATMFDKDTLKTNPTTLEKELKKHFNYSDVESYVQKNMIDAQAEELTQKEKINASADREYINTLNKINDYVVKLMLDEEYEGGKTKPLNSKPSLKSQNQVRKLKAVNTKPKPLNSKPSLKSQQEKKQKKQI